MIDHFDTRKLLPHSRILIYATPEDARTMINKILKSFKFDQGDRFTLDAKQDSFPPSEQHRLDDRVTAPKLQEIFLRQSMFLPIDENDQNEHKDDRPIHFLPTFIFGKNMHPEIWKRINKFTIIPIAYCVLHHLDIPDPACKRNMLNLLKASRGHMLLRIVTCDMVSVNR